MKLASRIYTIGHSTRTADEFVELLTVHRIRRLADVRTIPRSRRHPHFSSDALAGILARTGIEYRHFPELGGLRRPKADSMNSAWRNAAFRGYADHMLTAEFEQGVAALLEYASGGTGAGEFTAVMCAEALWWRCHRMLLSDALEMRSIEVFHIESANSPSRHRLTDFAQSLHGKPVYPGVF